MCTFFIVISRTSTIVDAAAEIGRNPTSKHKCESAYGNEQTDAGRTDKLVSRDRVLSRERGQGHFHFTCSADHE